MKKVLLAAVATAALGFASAPASAGFFDAALGGAGAGGVSGAGSFANNASRTFNHGSALGVAGTINGTTANGFVDTGATTGNTGPTGAAAGATSDSSSSSGAASGSFGNGHAAASTGGRTGGYAYGAGLAGNLNFGF